MSEKVEVPASAYEQFCAECLSMAEGLRNGTWTWIPHDRVLACRLAEAFEEGVAKLVPYPDEDPRWRLAFLAHCEQGGPQWFVHDILKRHLQECPDDEVVRWLIIAPVVYYCDNDFASELYRGMVAREPSNLRWLIASAVWVYACSGVETADRLRLEYKILRELNPKVEGALQDLLVSDDSHARWVAEIGEEVFRGATLSSMGEAATRRRVFPRLNMVADQVPEGRREQ